MNFASKCAAKHPRLTRTDDAFQTGLFRQEKKMMIIDNILNRAATLLERHNRRRARLTHRIEAALLLGMLLGVSGCWANRADQSPGTAAVDCRRETALTADMLRKSVHLKAGIGQCYTVSEQLTVGTDVRLKIDPGVKIIFTDAAGLSVHEGTLEARGSADRPIVFTGRNQEPGSWLGVRFMGTSSPKNILQYVIIEYAGATPGFAGTEPANLMLDDYYGKVNVALSEVTLRNSAGYGLYAEANARSKFTHNTLTENQKGAAYLSPVFLDQLDTDSDFTGNKNELVKLSAANLDGDRLKWPGLSVPYIVSGDLNLTGNSFVEIAPGAVFKFAENTGVSVFRSRFSARGKKDSPIVFTGVNSVPGFWKGILYIDTNSVDNVLEHVAIRYAGANPTYKGVEPANLMLDDYFGTVRLKLNNTELSHSGRYGLYAEAQAELDFAHNKLVQNTRAAALLDPGVVSALDAESSYAAHLGASAAGSPASDTPRPDSDTARSNTPGEDAPDTGSGSAAPAAPPAPPTAEAPAKRGTIEVMGTSLDGVTSTWPATDADYLVLADILVRDDAHLILEPGVTLIFAEGAGISVFRARISARGSAEKPIRFTGQTKKAGFWKGIHLVDTSSVENIFENVTIEYGGSARTFKGSEPANLMFDDYFGLVAATLNNVTTRFSGGAGMHIEWGAKIHSTNCGAISIEDEQKVTADGKSLRRACRL